MATPKIDSAQIEPISLKDDRVAHGVTLVQVAAEAGCSVGYVQKYELAPLAKDSRAEWARKRRKLDEIYSRFKRAVAA